ncbi:MAG: flagellar motor protein MotP [Planctomycetes bacterium RBG_16_64_12]|nr:MAG: flagellar motor protein MotP [Planctomycetes bacterium RBG_16_64_12]
MDVASVVGLFLGIALMVITVAIAPGASFGAFIDYPSLMIVVGGCIAAVLICFPLRSFLNTGRVLKKIFFNRSEDISQLIEQIVSLSDTARRDGLLALEGRVEEISNPFIVLGIQMAVDGTRPEVIEDIMRTEMDAVATRHQNGKKVLDQMGRFAPAFGMIGTLIGLIIMLGQLDDPDALGPGMAVALITTLYGALMSNVFFLPSAEKLSVINRSELLAMEVVVRGIMAIQSGENPRVIEQKLTTFIPPKLRTTTQEAA